MRRRNRPLRRPMQPRPAGQLNARVQNLLRRAHQMMETGNHTQAAKIFERLATGANDLGRYKNATHLFLQAGRAHLLSGNQEKGSACVFSGLEIVAKAEKWPLLAKIGQRASDEMDTLGYPEVSKEVAKWLQRTLPQPIEHYRLNHQSARSKTMIPLKCPYCGGTLRPGEFEMLDQVTAECPFCGSAIREE